MSEENLPGPEPGPARQSTPFHESEDSLTLLRRAQAGDTGALEQLYARYLPVLRRWATGRLPPKARDLLDTDDLVQETMIKTLKSLKGFEVRHGGALQAYLRLAVWNRIRDEIRRGRRAPIVTPLGSGEPDPQPSPLEAAIGSEALERYEAALARLAEDDREAIVLRVEMGYTHDEVAGLTGKSTADAARMAVSRALVRLAEEMTRGR